MSKRDIKAGRAWVELSVMDKLDVGLKSGRAKLDAFARGAAVAGTAMMAASLAVLGVLGAAAHTFADVGSKLFDMQAATGLNVEELSGLAYAAGQSGASLEDLGPAMKALHKFTLQVKQGAKGAAQTLGELGIAAHEFLAATPLQRTLMVAEALSKIEDAGIRAGLAQKVLGRGAGALAEMMKGGAAGIQAMIDQAHQLGLIVTTEEAEKADALGDAWGNVSEQLKMIAFVTGAAVADTLTEVFKLLSRGLALTIQFVRNNQTLVKIMAGVAIAGVAIGSAFLFLASAGFIASGALAAVNFMLLLFDILASPVVMGLVLLAAALFAIGGLLVLGATYFFLFTDAGQGAAAAISSAFQAMWGVVGGILEDMFRAMVDGRWELAGQIMAVAIAAGMLRVLASLKGQMGMLGDVLFGNAIELRAKIADAVLNHLRGLARGHGLDLVPPNQFGGRGFGAAGAEGTAASAFNAATAAAINRTIDPNANDTKRTADAAEEMDDKLGSILDEIRTRDLRWA